MARGTAVEDKAKKPKLVMAKGTTVLKEEPFASILYGKYRKVRCDHCFKKGKITLCTGCKFVGYCNSSCQSFAWAKHKIECSHLRNIQHPDSFPDEARLIARIVWHLTSGGKTDRGYYTKKDYRTFDDLISHLPYVSADEKKMEHFNHIYEALQSLLTEKLLPSYPIALHIYGQICVNAYNITDEDMANAGMGIYLGASIIDHNCEPNAVITFEGQTLSVTLTQDIPGDTLDWSKIFIAYVDVIEPTEIRQNELYNQYYFICECNRCKDETETGKMCAAECPNPKCDYLLDLRKPISMCPTCDKLIPLEYQEMYDYLMEFTQQQLYEMSLYDSGYLDVLQQMLKMQKGVFAPQNIWYIKTLEAAFDSAIDFDRQDLALEYGKALCLGYERYYGDVHPSTAIIYMKVGRLLLEMERPLEAYGSLRSAAEILEVTHGTEHSVYKNLLEPSLIVAQQANEDSIAALRAQAAREAAARAAAAPPPQEEQ